MYMLSDKSIKVFTMVRLSARGSGWEVNLLDQVKMGRFICEQRKRKHYTQQQLADELGVTFHEGTYILSATIAGIVDRSDVIDGSRIQENDVVLAIASNGVHTNGYSLIRLLMDRYPEIKLQKMDGMTFIEQIMKPHRPYYGCLKGLFGRKLIHELAHITGGGIPGNLCRILPEGLSARIDLSKIPVLPIFRFIQETGNISDAEMLATFNLGVGMCVVAAPGDARIIQEHIGRMYPCYPIGTVERGKEKVVICQN